MFHISECSTSSLYKSRGRSVKSKVTIPVTFFANYYQFIRIYVAMDFLLHGFCRTAIIVGTAVPLALFLIWDAVILGTIPNLDMSGNKITDPLELLRSNNGIVGVSS